MITKETITDFFADLEKSNDFNINEKLLWSYFFLDKNHKKLKAFSMELEKLGYRFKSIFEAEKVEPEDDQEYYLQVEEVQHHTIESLHTLNQFFYHFAQQNNIDSYDGFDVGNIISSENIR